MKHSDFQLNNFCTGDSNRGLAVQVPVFEGRHHHIHCTPCIVSSPRCLSRVVQTTLAPVNQTSSNVVMHEQYKLFNIGKYQCGKNMPVHQTYKTICQDKTYLDVSWDN